MKRFLLILFCLFSYRVYAVIPVALHTYAEYFYNSTYAHQAAFGVLVDADFAKSFALRGGVNLQSTNVYAGTLGGKVRFGLPVGYLFLDNEYLYKAFVRNHTQQITIALALGYAMDYVSIRVGAFSKFFCALPQKKYSAANWMIEPFDLLYDVRAFIFRPLHNWNLGLKISNLDLFEWEHFTNPQFSLLGSAKLSNSLHFNAELACMPIGMFSVAANFYEVSFRAGICYKW